MSDTPPPPIASPCTGVCRMDAAAGYCRGCHRTLDEIARWGQMDDAERRRIMYEQLPQRQRVRE